jgi:hypothetical protein
LGEFKGCHKIKHYTKHGEAQSINLDTYLDAMSIVKNFVSKYKSKNTFIFNEIALFCKMLPAKGVAHERLAVTKNAILQLALGLCCYATVFERLTF